MLELIAVDETNEISIHEVATMITDAMGLNNGLQVKSDYVNSLFIIDQVDIQHYTFVWIIPGRRGEGARRCTRAN